MDLKRVTLFLGLWKCISCYFLGADFISRCYSYNQYDVNKNFDEYDEEEMFLHQYNNRPCKTVINCLGISNIANIESTENPNIYCSSWRKKVIFRNICENGYLIDCANCGIEDFGYFFEFEIIDSACGSIPTIDHFPNLEVIQMHNTKLADISINSHYLHKLTLLDLSQNNISNINTLELYSASNLQVLNVSYNIINTINDQVFRYIPSLTKLDLKYNSIDNITSKTFYGLHNLNILYLSYNRISDINSAFENLIALEELYLDHNNLSKINRNDFKDLQKLKILKLNYNSIIEFDRTAMEPIPMLRVFDVSYNGIEHIRETAFEKNFHLTYVDLSYNSITHLVPNIFLQKNISFFAIKSNSLGGSLEYGMFAGMEAISELDLSHQYIDAVGDYAFYGLTELSILLLNNNKIENISRIGFDTLSGLQLLDLSNNMLNVIDFNMNVFNNLNKLLLKNNLIADMGPINYGEMPCLEFLDLSQNNLTSLNSYTYGPILIQLKEFDVSHNSLRFIQDDIFEKFVNIQWINFSFNSNLTIASNLTNHTLFKDHPDILQASEFQSVDFTYCDMDDVKFLNLRVFKTITSLNLNYNTIKKIEYGMFSSNKELLRVDVSYNQISHIQPGSFKDNNKLQELSIAHNELLELEYGTFRGLNNLKLLDISFNKIKTLKHGRFYETSSLNTLIADNNNIETVEYGDFIGVKLSTLSIGGNPIPCIFLVNLKTETHTLQVTALNIELHLPNFEGVSCISGGSESNKNLIDMSYTANNNLSSERRDILLEDIRNVLVEIKKTNYSEGSDPARKTVLLQIFNLTESIKRAFYKIDETNDRLIDIILDLNRNNSNLAQAYANMSTLTQNMIKTANRSDETNNKLIQIINKIDENFKKNNEILEYFKKQIKPQEDNNNNHTQYVSEIKNGDASQSTKSVLGDKAMSHSDKLLSNVGEPMQPNQIKSTLSDVCLMLMTVIMFCFMLYKVYELNLFRSFHRGPTASLHHMNESIVSTENDAF